MVRQHYALGNQNRIIRLEFKQRYFELFGKRSDEVEERLNFGQIAVSYTHLDVYKRQEKYNSDYDYSKKNSVPFPNFKHGSYRAARG